MRAIAATVSVPTLVTTDLKAGLLYLVYLDVHTRQNVAGELRGQLHTRAPVRS